MTQKPAPHALTMPQQWLAGVVFASPHSGSAYPADLLRQTVLSAREIRSSEDAFVDLLFSAAPRLGAPLLAAEYPRAYVDLNRSADELDPALIRGVPRHKLNPRVASGLGVIPRVVANGQAIYRGKLSLEEAERRIGQIWRPYHDCLAGLLSDCRDRFGTALLIDCHSMPHEAIGIMAAHRTRPDIVLGDRFGAAAAPEFVDLVEDCFADAGFRVARNAPFAGAYTAQHYGRPTQGCHVVQVEIDRALYMDERTIRPSADFGATRAAIEGVVGQIITRLNGQSLPLAAE